MRELELLESRQAKPVLTISRDQPGYLDLPSETLDRLICTEPIEKYYEVEDQPFARGKFAAVRKCTHRATGQAFAAKFLRKRRRSAELRAEIVHEVAVLEACAACPRVVRLHHVFESDAEMILLLELAPGGELQMLLDQDEVPEERQVARLMRQILDGVCYLHSINVAHLDIKPQNLVLTGEYPECDVKLCDFGISRYISHGADIREILGTPDYVAPEVLNYEPISLATDMWSVGVLVYVLLTGCSPFGGDSKQETFCNISQCKLDFPEDLFDEISEEAKDLISRLLVKDPSKRLSATECLAHAWFCSQGVLQPVSVPAKVATSVTKVTTCVSEAVRSPTPITETCQPPAPIKPAVPSLAAIKTTVSSPTIKRKQASPILSRTRAISPVPGSKPSGPVVPPIKAANTSTVPQSKVQTITNAAIVSRTLVKTAAPLSLPPPLPSTPPPLPSTPPPSLSAVKKNGIKADRKSAFKKNMESLVQMIDTSPPALPTAASMTTATTTTTSIKPSTKVDNDNANNNNNNSITNSATSLPAAPQVSRAPKSSKVTATHTLPAGFRHQFGPSNLFTAMMQGNQVPRRAEERESVYKFKRCYVDSEEDHNASAVLHTPHRMFLHSSGPSSTGSDSPYEHSSDTSSDTVSEMSIDSSSDRSSIISLDDSLDLAFSKRLYGDHSNWDMVGSFNVRLYRQQLLQQARNSNSSNIRRVWPKECNGSFARAFSLFSEDPKSKDSNRLQSSRRWKPTGPRSVTTNCTLNGATGKGLRKCSVELMREENGNLVVIREVENGKYSRFSEVKCESLQSRIRKLQVQGAQS